MTEYQKSKKLIKKYGKTWLDHLDEFANDPFKINVGELFYTSWGYDQTNYDYIIIVAISETGKTVTCKRAKRKHIGVSGTSNIQSPLPEPFGLPFRMCVRKYNDEVSLVGSYIFCGGEDSQSKRKGYFGRCTEKNKFYETDVMFGH